MFRAFGEALARTAKALPCAEEVKACAGEA